jgi:hypothetical protein
MYFNPKIYTLIDYNILCIYIIFLKFSEISKPKTLKFEKYKKPSYA